MRHLKAGRRLGVTPSHRKAMIRNLMTSLFEHGRIRTTLARAKELRKHAERLITLSKKGNLHAIRLAMEKLKSKDVCHKLFNEIAPLNQNVQGGYTRIYKLENRKGDNAKMAFIEVIHYPEDQQETVDDNKQEETSKALLDTVEEQVSGDISSKDQKVAEKSKQDALDGADVQTATEEKKDDTDQIKSVEKNEAKAEKKSAESSVKKEVKAKKDPEEAKKNEETIAGTDQKEK